MTCLQLPAQPSHQSVPCYQYNPLAYSWANDEYEASNEVLYCTKLNNVKGTCIFSYKAFVRSKNNEDSKAFKGLQRIKNEYWTEKVKTPTTMASK